VVFDCYRHDLANIMHISPFRKMSDKLLSQSLYT